MESSELRARIEALAALPVVALGDEAEPPSWSSARPSRAAALRAAEPGPDGWTVNAWVKKGILLGLPPGAGGRDGGGRAAPVLRQGHLASAEPEPGSGVRIVPGGTAVRAGAYLAPGVVVMPPAYVNVGAWVGEGTLVDSHALVGSCAQIGRRVHLSAAAQIGGVLEPVGALPVIVEDEAFVGGNSGVYEGTIVGRRAVLAAGVILTGSVPVYDLPRKTTYRRTADRLCGFPRERWWCRDRAASMIPSRRGWA